MSEKGENRDGKQTRDGHSGKSELLRDCQGESKVCSEVDFLISTVTKDKTATEPS